MKLILFMAAFIAGALYTYAQKTIKGQIIDAITKTPLSGATITFSNKGGTMSDQNGYFIVDLNKTIRITVSYLGYESVQKIIKHADEELVIALVPAIKELNEVEITATSNPNRSVLYQPASISKLSTTELKRSTGVYLD